MATPKPKTVPFTKEGVAKLPNDKPVVYTIKDGSSDPAYVGVAKRGRVHERLEEHLPKGPDPIKGGVKVTITQKPTIKEAEKSEAQKISRVKPPQNIKGK